MTTSTSADNGKVIFTKTIRLRNGKIIHAAAFGLQAFRIIVKERKR